MSVRAVSEVKRVDHDIVSVYSLLSDFDRLGNMLSMATLSSDELGGRVEEVRVTSDCCTLMVDGVGEVVVRIEERQPPSMVKFGGDSRFPFPFHAWVQLLEGAPNKTRLRVTCEVEVNAMLKVVLMGRLEKFVNQVADGLARLPYHLNDVLM
jgi:hypothetical protein